MTRPALLLATLAAAFSLEAAVADTPAQPADITLFLSLPPPVRRAVLDQVSDEKLEAVTRTNTVDEPLVFQIQTSKSGQTRDLTIAADGKILDKQVFLGETPVPVRKSIQTLISGSKLGGITKNIDDTFTETYIVEMTRDSTNREFIVDDGGELQEWQVFLPELPPPVQKRILEKSANAALGDITKTFDDEDYEVAYEVQMNRAGKTRSFTVSTNGELLDEQVFMDEIPAPVQKSIQAETKRGRLGDIKKSIDEGQTYYSVDVVSLRKTVSVTFDAAGVFWGEEEDMTWEALPPAVKRALKPFQRGSEITDVNRTTEGANTTYEIEFRDDHKEKRYLDLKPDGTVIP